MAGSDTSFLDFLLRLEEEAPAEVLHVTEPVNPERFEVTSVLQRLEDLGHYPMVVFDRPLDLFGNPSPYPIATNVYATRQRCALALGLTAEQAYQELSLEYARREEGRIPPVRVGTSEAPVKEVMRAGGPLRLTASETWGEDFLVPADADIIIEGEVLPGEREVEGPFGEFPGTYGPQRVRWVVEVKAVTHRERPIYQDVFVGHRDVNV